MSQQRLVVGIDLLPAQQRARSLGKCRVGGLCSGLLIVVFTCLQIYFFEALGQAAFGGEPNDAHILEGEIAEIQSKISHENSALMEQRDQVAQSSAKDIKRRSIAALLSTLAQLTPSTVTVERVALTVTAVEVVGVAKDVESVREWLGKLALACGGYNPALKQLKVTEFGRVKVHGFTAHIERPVALERVEPCQLYGGI